ncbi:hypothetical protein DFH09DRAFT_1322582 [Mycena vulgaris]|nr:hypothetical protein DFH09DRAFT_1322582 [Mycena vulgaris]
MSPLQLQMPSYAPETFPGNTRAYAPQPRLGRSSAGWWRAAPLARAWTVGDSGHRTFELSEACSARRQVRGSWAFCRDGRNNAGEVDAELRRNTGDAMAVLPTPQIRSSARPRPPSAMSPCSAHISPPRASARRVGTGKLYSRLVVLRNDQSHLALYSFQHPLRPTSYRGREHDAAQTTRSVHGSLAALLSPPCTRAAYPPHGLHDFRSILDSPNLPAQPRPYITRSAPG